MNVLDAIQWLTQAWDAVKPSTIVKCVAKCGIGLDNVPAECDDDEDWDDDDLLPILQAGSTMREFVEMDSDLSTSNTVGSDWEAEILSHTQCRDMSVSDSESDGERECEGAAACISMPTA